MLTLLLFGVVRAVGLWTVWVALQWGGFDIPAPNFAAAVIGAWGWQLASLSLRVYLGGKPATTREIRQHLHDHHPDEPGDGDYGGGQYL